MPEVIQKQFTGLYTQNKDNKIENKIMLLVAGTGGGKSIHKNAIAQVYKNDHKYIWISLTDEKNNFENAYQMFPPEENWHKLRLQKEGREEKAEKVIIWHPYTENLPTTKHPNMKIFTIPIKSLGREEISVLIETDADKSSVKLFLDSIRQLKKEEGISDMLYYASQSLERKTSGTGKNMSFVPDAENFWLPHKTSGTSKTISELIGNFKPFFYGKDYILTPENCPSNLDVEQDIFKNQEYTHVLVTKYIQDRKIKDFVIMWFILNILRNIDKCKKPILWDFEEIRKWLPFSAKGWKHYIAQNMKEHLSVIRSIGRGNTVLMTSQVYTDIHPYLRDSVSPGELYIGALGNLKDVKKISETLRMSTEEVRTLSSIGRNEFMVRNKELSGEKFTFLMPKFMHAEESYDFFDMYKRYNKIQPENYPFAEFKETITNIDNFKKQEIKKAQERVKEITNSMEKQFKNDSQIKYKGKNIGTIKEKEILPSKKAEKIVKEVLSNEIIPKDENPLHTIIKQSYKMGKTYKEIALDFDMSIADIKNIVNI